MSHLEVMELERALDNPKTEAPLKDILEILLLSINDWPSDISAVEEYELALREFIGEKLTNQNIGQALRQIDYAKYAWQAESLSQLEIIFQFYDEDEEITVSDIITDIKTNIK